MVASKSTTRKKLIFRLAATTACLSGITLLTAQPGTARPSDPQARLTRVANRFSYWSWPQAPANVDQSLNRSSYVELAGWGAAEGPECTTPDIWYGPIKDQCTVNSSVQIDSSLGNWNYRLPLRNMNGQRYGYNFMLPQFQAATDFDNPKYPGRRFGVPAWSIQVTKATIKRKEGQELKMDIRWSIDGYNGLRDTFRDGPNQALNQATFELWAPARLTNSGGHYLNAAFLCSTDGSTRVSPGVYKQIVDTDNSYCDSGGPAAVMISEGEGNFSEAVINIGDFKRASSGEIIAFITQSNLILAWIRCPAPSNTETTCRWSYPSIYKNVNTRGSWMPYQAWSLGRTGTAQDDWLGRYVLPEEQRHWSLVNILKAIPSYSGTNAANSDGTYQSTIGGQLIYQYIYSCMKMAQGLAATDPRSNWPTKTADLNYLRGCLQKPYNIGSLSTPISAKLPSPSNLRLKNTAGWSTVCDIIRTDDRRTIAEAIERHGGGRQSIDCS